MDCIFCKILKKEIPSTVILDNKNVFAFLDIRPVNLGHILIIPKKHYRNIYDIPEDQFCLLAKFVKKISIALKKALHADGINLGMNNDEAAGQIVEHAHIHIIPRFKNDGLKHWPQKNYKNSEGEQIAKKIRKNLDNF